MIVSALSAAPAPAQQGAASAAAPGIAAVTVDCAQAGASIQAAVDAAIGATVIFISGTCVENVVIAKDDVTLDADRDAAGTQSGSATVSGTITFDAAARGVVANLAVTGAGDGVKATNGASIRVVNCVIADNETGGIVVTRGAHAAIAGNLVTGNGFGARETSSGVAIDKGGTAEINDNDVSGNKSHGIGVSDGAFAAINFNTITGNGRGSPFFEAGIDVSRAVARGFGNVIRDNGYAAIQVFNSGAYRSGSFLTPDLPDNAGPFEIIAARTGEVAIDIGRMSLLDLRQVEISGRAFVSQQSFLEVRGDNRDSGSIVRRSTMNGLAVSSDSGVRLRFVELNGEITVGLQSFADLGDVTGSFSINCVNGGVVFGSAACP